MILTYDKDDKPGCCDIREMGWKTIDTAPKDETVILLFCLEHDVGAITDVNIFSGYWCGCGCECWTSIISRHGCMAVVPSTPTHWKPLPELSENVNKESICGKK